jgi:hypothetical protein
MKNIILFPLISIVLFLNCRGQPPKVLLSDLTFNSIFGFKKNDSINAYCLLGTGFFRTPRSDNSDSLVASWITKHPNAEMILISTLDEPKEKLHYCWLVDKDDTINNYLVRNGCFPGGTMIRPQTYDEMSGEMKEMYHGIEKPRIIVHIDRKSYERFIEQIKVAETFAENNKLGIWKQKN